VEGTEKYDAVRGGDADGDGPVFGGANGEETDYSDGVRSRLATWRDPAREKGSEVRISSQSSL